LSAYAGNNLTSYGNDRGRVPEKLIYKAYGKKINILIEGRQKTVECVRVIKVEDGVVVVELRTGGICVIPLNEISAVCMSKELAQEYYKV
jgi:hypothetical protein